MEKLQISSPTTVDRFMTGTAESMQSHSEEVGGITTVTGLILNVERTCEFRVVGDSTIRGGGVRHREKVIECEFQTETKKFLLKSPTNSC